MSYQYTASKCLVLYAAAAAAVAFPSWIPVVMELCYVAFFLISTNHTISSYQHRKRFEWN
jgi:hypothetical protein